jgi:hypothetical protein
MTRKTLVLGAGLTLAVAGMASASERNRGAIDFAAKTDGVAASAAAPADFQQIDGSTLLVTRNGQDFKMHANGAVYYDEVIEAFGSVERMNFEAGITNVASTLGSDGTRLYANGATGFFADLLGTSMPKPALRTVAEFKEVTPWAEKVVDGVTVVAFANGVVLTDESVAYSQPIWVSHRERVPFKIDENGVRFYADGAVFLEPAFQPKESQ